MTIPGSPKTKSARLQSWRHSITLPKKKHLTRTLELNSSIYDVFVPLSSDENQRLQAAAAEATAQLQAEHKVRAQHRVRRRCKCTLYQGLHCHFRSCQIVCGGPKSLTWLGVIRVT